MRAFAISAVVLAAVVSQIWTAPPAQACSCSVGSDEQAYEAADAVFLADVEFAPSPPTEGAWSSIDPAVWTFSVTGVYKGTVSERQGVVSAISGASCGLELPSQGTVVVFATAEPQPFLVQPVEGADLYADLCGGSRSIDRAPIPASFGPPSEPAAQTSEVIPVSQTGLVTTEGRNLAPLLIGGAVVILGAGAVALVAIRRRRT